MVNFLATFFFVMLFSEEYEYDIIITVLFASQMLQANILVNSVYCIEHYMHLLSCMYNIVIPVDL